MHLNKKYWTLVERKPSKHGDLSFVNAVHPDDRPQIERALKAAFSQHHGIDVNLRILCGESQYRLFRITANTERQGNGKLLVFAAYEPIDPGR